MCHGCPQCIGHSFLCNTCQRNICVAANYGGKSGIQSVGRDVFYLRKYKFDDVLEELCNRVEQHLHIKYNDNTIEFNHCTYVILLNLFSVFTIILPSIRLKYFYIHNNFQHINVLTYL